MTALTGNYEAKRQDGEMIDVKVKASTTVYKGALLVDKGTGYAEPGDDGYITGTTPYTFLGVAVEKADNSSGIDGAIYVRIYKTGAYQYTKASAVQTDLGKKMFVHDDQTVGTSSTSSVFVGHCVDIVDSTHIKLRIDLAVDEDIA